MLFAMAKDHFTPTYVGHVSELDAIKRDVCLLSISITQTHPGGRTLAFDGTSFTRLGACYARFIWDVSRRSALWARDCAKYL